MATKCSNKTINNKLFQRGTIRHNSIVMKIEPNLRMRLFISAASLVILAGVFQLVALAEDWPRWGGNDPGRNMYSPAKGLPYKVDAGKFKRGTEEVDMSTTTNVKWVSKLGSQSYGNVSVANGRVYVGTNNDSPRDPQHQGDRSILLVFDEQTGSFLWQLVVPKLAAGNANDWQNLGILSSPNVEGDRIYLVTSRCEVICLDVNGFTNGNQGFQDEAQYVVGPGKPKAKIGPKDADIIWVYDMIGELDVFPHNASNCSVSILGDFIYTCTSNGQDWNHSTIPSPSSPSLIALNKNTGEFAGQDDALFGPRIFHGQWNSPSTGTVNGKPLVFFGGGDGVCYAFNAEPVQDTEADTSWLKKLWWYDCNPPDYKTKNGKEIKYPAADGPSEIIATPVFYNKRVYVAIGQDPEHGEGLGRLVCMDATQSGDITETGTIWEYRGIYRSLSTVSIDPETGLLFVGDFSGFVHCVDAETGELYWVHDMKAHLWGSTLVADGKVFVGDEDGDFLVLAATKEEKKLSEIYLNSPIYSTPVVANGVVYLTLNSHLYAFHDSAQ